MPGTHPHTVSSEHVNEVAPDTDANAVLGAAARTARSKQASGARGGPIGMMIELVEVVLHWDAVPALTALVIFRRP